MTAVDGEAALRAATDRSASGRVTAAAVPVPHDRAAGARRRAAETKRRRTRAAILAAAARLFEEQGGAETTMDQIATAAGVSQAALYLHFPNKWQVAGAGLAAALAGVADPDAAYLQGLDHAAAVDRFLAAIVRVDADHAAYVRVTAAALLETSRARSRTDIGQLQAVIPTLPALIELIRRGQIAGAFLDFPTPVDAGLLLVHMLVMHISVHDDEPVEKISILVRTAAARLLGYPAPSAGG